MPKKLKKISTDIPAALMEQACKMSNLNQTETLIAGLKALIIQHRRSSIIDLKGKIKIGLDLNELRQRTRL